VIRENFILNLFQFYILEKDSCLSMAKNVDNINNNVHLTTNSNMSYDIAVSRLQDFDMIRTIGVGTYGCVKLCQHKATRQKYVLKIMKKNAICGFHQEQHIINEKNVLLQCVNHPRIVHIYKTFSDEQTLYILMEYVPGGELYTQIRRKKLFQTSTIKFYGAQLITIFEFLHSRNMIYRDLKPENVLLDRQGNIKLTDFGFARHLDPGSLAFTICGTPEYLAPEMILSTGSDQGVDWWTLGILLYEMACGYPPFIVENDNNFDLYNKIIKTEVEFIPSFNPLLKDLISKLLEKDKTKRLGKLRGGTQDVKNHPFFAGLNWEAIIRGLSIAPIRPPIFGDNEDSAFEKYDENENQTPDSEIPPISNDGMQKALDILKDF